MYYNISFVELIVFGNEVDSECTRPNKAFFTTALDVRQLATIAGSQAIREALSRPPRSTLTFANLSSWAQGSLATGRKQHPRHP
jgi:hypothetical protein